MLHKDLLDVICCPVCKGDLEERTPDQLLVCSSCGKTYPIRDGIPMLLPDDADSR